MKVKGTEILNSAECSYDLPHHSKAIRPQDLKPGDILLHRPPSMNIVQKKIAEYTKSPFTHASIYLGEGNIAHSTPPVVRIDSLAAATIHDRYAGVLRSQLGFGPERVATLRDFVEALIAKDAPYDFTGIASFVGRNKQHFGDIVKQVQENYGSYSTRNDFEGQAYFCSALVAACVTVVGAIGRSAQVLYPPNVLSPGDLHRDPTFGWFVGYLIQPGQEVPGDDPLLTLTDWYEANGLSR